MLQVAELKRWLETLSPKSCVGVDEGGLCLVCWEEPTATLEIGGLPEDEEFSPDSGTLGGNEMLDNWNAYPMTRGGQKR
jgi:hypothetical protein